MSSFIQQLSTYAKYHRDPRNIVTHLFGVPIIVFAVIVLLSKPTLFELAGIAITPAILAFLVTSLFYLRLHAGFGAIMIVLMGAGLYGGALVAQMSTTVWLASGLVMFIGGWAIQFLGHHYEGKKPAFVDDLVGLLIGPLFVTAEILFALGCFTTLKKQIEIHAGPVRKVNGNTNISKAA
ncbi:MAG: Mpo1-like protein [Glaciecola sp.]